MGPSADMAVAERMATDKDDGFVGSNGEIGEEGGLFHGVGAVGHHDAIDVFILGQFVQFF